MTFPDGILGDRCGWQRWARPCGSVCAPAGCSRRAVPFASSTLFSRSSSKYSHPSPRARQQCPPSSLLSLPVHRHAPLRRTSNAGRCCSRSLPCPRSCHSRTARVRLQWLFGGAPSASRFGFHLMYTPVALRPLLRQRLLRRRARFVRRVEHKSSVCLLSLPMSTLTIL